MFMTHTNSVYSEKTVLINYARYPQYVHQVFDGGIAVRKGIKIMPGKLVDCVLQGAYVADSGTVEFIQALTNRSDSRIGFILAAGNGGWFGYLPRIQRSEHYPEYLTPILGAMQVYAGQLANLIGSFDYIATDSTSCISGHSAWYTARNMLQLDLLDAVVVVATDNGICEDYLELFGEHGLAKLAKEEHDDLIVKFHLGQACNISVFENEITLARTQHIPLARITDMCIAAESYGNPLGISPEGYGYSKVIHGVDTSRINFVKTHSTFSADNRIEDQLIKEKFGTIPTINYKLRIGHTMGASTAVETALAIKEESGIFLSLGAGMGNVFSAAVVEIAP